MKLLDYTFFGIIAITFSLWVVATFIFDSFMKLFDLNFYKNL